MNSLESHVLRLIGEDLTSPDVFADSTAGLTQIRDSINDAIQELCMVTGSYTMPYLLPLKEDQQFYRLRPLQGYIGWVSEAWDRSKHRKLEQTDVLTLTQLDPWWLQTTGSPLQYLQIGQDWIGVYRVPSASGTVLELNMTCIPVPYTDSGQPIKLREMFQRATVYFAVGEFYASRGDAKRATEYHLRYLDTAGIMGMHPKEQDRLYQLGTFDYRQGQPVEAVK